MSECWAIKDYRSVFWLKESCRHKEVSWGKFPASRNSTSYRRLMRSKEGHTAYCVFVAIWRLVTRAKSEDGSLVIKGKPITAEDIHDESGIELKRISDSLEMLQSPEIGWLVAVAEAGSSRECAGSQPLHKRDCPGMPTGTSTSSSSLPDSGSGFISMRDRAILEQPTKAWEKVEIGMAGLLGRSLASHELAKVGTWADRHAEVAIEIHGAEVPGIDLLMRAIQAAKDAGACGTIGGIMRFCDTVIDRCTRQKCWPDETPKLKQTKFKTVGGGVDMERMKRIAAEATKENEHGD